MTDPLGQSQVLPYIKGLSQKGYKFHLISFEKTDRFNKHKKHIRNICDEANITWHPQNYSQEKGILKTVRQVRQLYRVSDYLQEIHNFEIVHCRSYISALVGLRLKKKSNVKFIFDMRGFWADERVDGGLWSLKNPLYNRIYNYFKKKEIKFFNQSDYTISLTECGKNEITSWPKINSDIKIEVIPCCVDLDLFDPLKITQESKDEFRRKLGIDSSDYILGYVGSIGTWYMLSEMLDYFKVLKSNKTNAKFLFVSGESPEVIISKAVEKGISKHDLIITSVLHYQVPMCISLFDSSIFFIRSTYSKKASSPTKQGEIMAMGIPLLCNTGVGDTDEIVKRYNSGCVIQSFSEEEYKSALNKGALAKPELIAQGAKEYFSLEEGINRYLRVYKEVMKNSK